MTGPRRVLFLDGIGCNPEGYKPRFMAGLGYHVTAPPLPDLDFPAAVAMADAAVTGTAPDVIVGYSRGGAVALSLRDRTTPRLLIAPALHWVAEGQEGFRGRLVILHSATDDGLPLDGVRDELARCGPTADLRVVGADHTMIDPEALSALTDALRELTGRGTPNPPPQSAPAGPVTRN